MAGSRLLFTFPRFTHWLLFSFFSLFFFAKHISVFFYPLILLQPIVTARHRLNLDSHSPPPPTDAHRRADTMTKPRNRHHPYPKALLRKKKAGNKEGEMEWNCKNCGRIKIKSLREGDVQPPSPGSQGAPAQRLDQGQVGEGGRHARCRLHRQEEESRGGSSTKGGGRQGGSSRTRGGGFEEREAQGS